MFFYSAIHGNRKRLAIVIPKEVNIIAVGRSAFGLIIMIPASVFINIHLPSNVTDDEYDHAVQVARQMILAYIPTGNPDKKRIIFGVI